MIDTMPLWFWLPAATVLWAWALYPYVRRNR